MKRNLLLFVIVGLVLFGGCTEKADLQTVPLAPLNEGGASLDINYFSENNDTGKDERILMKFLGTDRLNPIKAVLELLENDTFQMVSDNGKKVLRNKLEAIVLMYKENNPKGAINKLCKDLLPKVVGAFTNCYEGEAVKQFLVIQKILFENPDIPSNANFMPSAQLAPIIIAAIIAAAAAITVAIIKEIGKTDLSHAGLKGDYYYYPDGTICASFDNCSNYQVPDC